MILPIYDMTIKTFSSHQSGWLFGGAVRFVVHIPRGPSMPDKASGVSWAAQFIEPSSLTTFVAHLFFICAYCRPGDVKRFYSFIRSIAIKIRSGSVSFGIRVSKKLSREASATSIRPQRIWDICVCVVLAIYAFPLSYGVMLSVLMNEYYSINFY